ncbi:Hypothetical predicted protein, partial [Drosophila guanche]
MADSTDPGKDPTIDAGGGGAADAPPIPAVRRRRAHEHKSSSRENIEEQEQLETSTVTRTYMKTITTSLTTSSSNLEEEYSASSSSNPNQQRLRQKVAQYEKIWSDGTAASGKRTAEVSSEELRQDSNQDDDPENPFDIDVHEIERRLRLERQRGMAEAEAAKLAFQQVQLRHTTPPPPPPSSLPRRVEVTSEQTASPFNVTLRTTSRMSPGADHGNVEEQLSPFNVTLRTTNTRRHTRKVELERFLEGERMVREVPAADGVRTIITSSMTSDGGYAEEKIYRHGEGYVSPRDSPSWSRSHSSYSGSERSSVTPPRSVDLTAGGRRILIKLENETELGAGTELNDETDSSAVNRRHQDVAMATGNIDITVGSSNPRRRLYQQTTVQVGGNVAPPQQLQQQQQQQQQQQRPRELSLETGGTKKKTMLLTSTPIGTKEQPQEPISPAGTCQLRGSSAEEQRKIVSHKTITTTGSSTTKSKSKSSTSSSSTYTSTSRKLIDDSPSPSAGNISFTASQISLSRDNVSNAGDIIDNDSDTEGRPASSIVIVSTPSRSVTPSTPSTTAAHAHAHAHAHALSGIGTFSKSLRQDYQTQVQQSGSRGSSSNENEYQEFQSTMASINFARSNSQYDSHIKEKR